MRLVRRFHLDERKIDGAVHWNSMSPKLRNAFQKRENSRPRIGYNTFIMEAAT